MLRSDTIHVSVRVLVTVIAMGGNLAWCQHQVLRYYVIGLGM